MREKKRFLTVRVEFAEKLDFRTGRALVSQAVLETLGELGAAEAGFSFKFFDEGKQEAVVKCSAKGLDRVIAALALKRFFEGRDVALRVVETSASFHKN
ncbi:MAG: Rpp14/Pop5 family protein [Candidatus Micrarchaeota archaeon]